jgi:RHS repeat-associated protein
MTDCERNDIELPADIQNLPYLNKEYDIAMKAGGQDKLYYFNANHLGSGSLITDGSGQTYQTLAYAPYGEDLVNIRRAGNYEEPYKFTGYERDQESDMDYAHDRNYIPKISIFDRVDRRFDLYPHQNNYVYCGNNPIMRIDPTGMEATDYHNDKGELLYHTNDGLKDVIIVPDANIPKLEVKLQEAKDNGTINNPETNKNDLHSLGQTPQQYLERALTGGSDWDIGYKAEYERTYKGGKRGLLSTIINIVAHVNDDYLQMSGGENAGSMAGKSDRKEGRIDRLNPHSGLKSNSPKIKLRDKNKEKSSNCVLNQNTLPK